MLLNVNEIVNCDKRSYLMMLFFYPDDDNTDLMGDVKFVSVQVLKAKE